MSQHTTILLDRKWGEVISFDLALREAIFVSKRVSSTKKYLR